MVSGVFVEWYLDGGFFVSTSLVKRRQVSGSSGPTTRLTDPETVVVGGGGPWGVETLGPVLERRRPVVGSRGWRVQKSRERGGAGPVETIGTGSLVSYSRRRVTLTGLGSEESQGREKRVTDVWGPTRDSGTGKRRVFNTLDRRKLLPYSRGSCPRGK